LDKASEGLLLLTNDSEWAGRVQAPETHLAKVYHVQIAIVAGESLLKSFMKGVKTGGELLRVGNVGILRSGQRHSWLEITLKEGKNRHIRRMCEEHGIEVLRLLRVAIGPLLLGDLPKGGSRPLINAEKLALDAAMKGDGRSG
jgi:23S rRNA pseudouridine2605 synthase